MSNRHRQQTYMRWTINERVQHWVVVVSFFMLVLTGFALTYPESWWAWPFAATGAFDLRGLLHRLAATLYLAVSLFHLFYLIFTSRGRLLLRALRLRRSDMTDARTRVLQNLGRQLESPRFGHFTYWEKMEYWALVWGTLVMVTTGLLLWFENLSLVFFPLWAMDVATLIHFYEAVLATLSIFVWHFYFVMFNPRVYPLNFSMFDGVLTYEEMEEEHAGELDAMAGAAAAAAKEAEAAAAESSGAAPEKLAADPVPDKSPTVPG